MTYVRFAFAHSSSKTSRLSWLRFACRVLAVALGAAQTWTAAISHSMNADGISYLDIADAYLQGDWQSAINAVWSPMYSWLLGITLHLFKPSMAWEFPTVHLLNFAIFLCVLVSFEYFWRQLGIYQGKLAIDGKWIGWPEWAWLSIGYMLFTTTVLQLITVWAVTPDMLMAGFVLVAAALVVKIRLGNEQWRTFGALGLVLGLGYLAKSIMFPISLAMIPLALFSSSSIRRNWLRALLSLSFFLLVAAPFVGAISAAKGRLTIGEAGAYTYAKHVNGIRFSHWQGEEEGNGTPTHPTRQILDDPPIYEFASPIGGTYPIAFDPSYWHEGLKVYFDPGQQMGVVVDSILFYYDLLVRQQAGLFIGMLILFLLVPSWWKPDRRLVHRFGLSLLALVPMGLYAIMTVIGRYVGVFVALFWADLLASARLPESADARRLMNVMGAVMTAALLFNLVAFHLEGLQRLDSAGSLAAAVEAQRGPPSWPGETAQALHSLGIRPGDPVAVIGYGFDSFWARLARVKIVAEMVSHEAAPFWHASPETQEKVIAAFASTGAKAIVAESVPYDVLLSGWWQVEDSDHFIYLMDVSE